jgi:hypothetical protein
VLGFVVFWGGAGTEAAVTTYCCDAAAEAAYVADLAALTYPVSIAHDGFDVAPWGTETAFPGGTPQPSLSNLGITWSPPATDGFVATSTGGGDVHDGSHLMYALDSSAIRHPVPDGYALSANGFVLYGMGGWFRGTNATLAFIVDNDPLRVDFTGAEATVAAWKFLGFIETDAAMGFSRLEIRTVDEVGNETRIFFSDDFTLAAEAGAFTPRAALVSSVLPISRSVQVGGTATAFATLINTGDVTATGCGISPATSVSADFSFQTTDPATNALTGSPNTPAEIPSDGLQSFVLAFSPTAPFPATDTQLNFACSNTEPASSVTGLNTLLLSASDTPVPDIVALAATPTGDGTVHLAGASASAAFSVATVNVGSSGVVSVSADTAGLALPVELSMCETEPGTGICLAPPAVDGTTSIAAGATPTFSVFVTARGEVPFDPAVNRLFVRFRDPGQLTRGATSVALTTTP